MKHIGTRYIETGRLIVILFILWYPLPQYILRHRHVGVGRPGQVLRHLVVRRPVSEHGGRVGQLEPAQDHNWAIILKENGSQPIGNISVAHWGEDTETPEIGYCMGRRWWHRGIMTEALGAALDFLFDRVGVERIVALHDTNNLHSGDVMRKCGVIFDGVREKAGKNNQGVVDMARYVLKASDR